MTLLRAVLVAGVAFGFLFDLTWSSCMEREACGRILELERTVSELESVRDQAQDGFDASVYLSLFDAGRTVDTLQQEEGAVRLVVNLKQASRR